MAYLPLSTANLPEPDISPADDAEPRDYFETFLYTGNGTGQQVGDVIKKPADTTTISDSLVFNDNDSAYLSQTFSSGNRQTWTWGGWVKRGNLGTGQNLFHSFGPGGFGVEGVILFNTSDQIDFVFDYNGGSRLRLTTTQLFRDPSAWYHIVVVADTTNATSGDRLRMYINGVRVTQFSSSNYPSQNFNGTLNQAYGHAIGANTTPSGYFDGYMAEIHFIDGTALDADDFGNFDANGIWIPKTVTGLTYGTNGFYLDFSDNTSTTTLGEDQEGSNDWTLNNFATTDQVDDSPTDNNFATFATDTNMTLSEGNKEIRSTSDFEAAHIHIPCSGKNYFEIEYVTKSASNDTIGVVSYAQTTRNWGTSVASGTGTNGRLGYAMTYEYSRTDTGQECDEGSVTSSVFTALSAGDVAQIAVDTETGEIWFGTNGTWENSGNPSTGANPVTTKSDWEDFTIALGGHPTNKFKIREESEWEYTAPTDFVSLTENNITVNDQNLESPDFVWIKNRDQADQHHLYDSVRGIQEALYSNANTAETNEPNGLLDFNANGFTIGSEAEVNTLNEDYVAWCWKAGGSSVSNTDGTITSQVSANTTSGFSIVSYTGNNTDGATVGTGLNQTLDFCVVKSRDASRNWPVKHSALTGENNVFLNTTSASGVTGAGNITFDETDTFTLNDGSVSRLNINNNNEDYIAYCFHSVEGFSKFGSYTGNGSTDGPFVYTGFRPAFVMIKPTSTGTDWVMLDSSRDLYNPEQQYLLANTSGAEGNIGALCDFLSNGFKLRTTSSNNLNGTSIIYMAFAENPFKYSNAR